MAGKAIFGQVPVDWEITTLGVVCERGGGNIQTGPFGSQPHASDYVSVGIPSVMPQNIGDNQIREDGIKRIAPNDAERLNLYLLREGDIVYSWRGDVERRALVRSYEAGWLCGTGCLRVRLGEAGADPLYASYFLAHPRVREWIVRHAHGATMANLNTSILAACPFVVPPINEQRAIAHILGALDDKIEVNRRMNATLEAIARAVFKDWFVDFGPIRARMEGRKPYLAPEIWGLFPDRLDDEGKPEEWELSEIGKEVESVGGATPSTKEPSFWEDGEYHWATPKDLSKLASPVLLNTDRKITEAGVKKINSGLLPVGTVLFSSRVPIGYLAVAEVPTSVNQVFIAMVCEKRLPNVFVLFWYYENLDYIKSISGGSTFAEISKKAFRPVPVVVPSEQILTAYESLVRPLYDRIVANTKESASLAQTRDLLLPKLISGELQTNDFSRLTEAAK